MTSQRRLQITVSEEMMVALTILAERSGLPLATQALYILRSGLHRTMTGSEFAYRTRPARTTGTPQAPPQPPGGSAEDDGDDEGQEADDDEEEDD